MFKHKKLCDLLIFGSVILFGFYPLIPERYESYIPIIFIASSLIVFLSNKKDKIYFKPFVVMSLVFIIFIFSALLSENLSLGFRKLETMASLIGMPIAFFIFLSNYKINFTRLQSIFSYAFFSSNIIFSLIALYLIKYYRNPKFINKDSDFFRSAITDIPYIGEHPIYISLFISIAILTGIYLFIYGRVNFLIKSLITIGLLILTIMLFLLMSKGVLLGLLLSLTILFLFKNKHWKRIFIIVSLLVVFMAVLLPKQNNRFLELFNKESFEQVDLNNSTSIRFNILKSAFNLCIEQPFLGYGLGDVQTKLDYEYNSNGLPLPIGQYNSHNQYLFIWLSCGFFGLIIFFFFLGYITKIAVKTNDHLLLSIIILYIVSFLFENILSRQSGVIIFSFLINLLVYKNLSLVKITNNTLPSAYQEHGHNNSKDF